MLLPPDHAYPPAPEGGVPPVAVRLTLPHAVVVPVILAVGKVLTVTTCSVVAVQPLAAVTVTV